MYRDHESKSIYDNLSMQAALRLYRPHSDSGGSIHVPETILIEVPVEPISHRICNLKNMINKIRRK